jgi:phage FluMu gp28-like protein
MRYERPKLFPYQSQIIDTKTRFTCTEASTKVGKTLSHIIWLFEQALQGKPGQSFWWVAPVYSQAEIAFNRMRQQVSDRNLFKAHETALTLALFNGTVISFKSAEKPDNLYGEDVYACVIDEASRVREESWFAVRSVLTHTRGKCKFIGNVSGRKNWFFKMCQQARTGDDPDYSYFKITAYDAAKAGMKTKDGRPFIEEINQAQKDLPENVFRELYLAEPTKDGANPFGFEHINRAVFPLSNQPAVCFGVDLAKRSDWTVITGLDKFGQVCHFDRFQKDWKQTVETILNLPRGFITIDSSGVGDPIAEAVNRIRDVEMFVFTQKSKQQLIEGLAMGIQNRSVTILSGVMQDELESFEFEYGRSGVKYSAPSGMHDDCVMSLGLAVKNLSISASYGRYCII